MYELMLDGGKRVLWEGVDGLDACRRYVDAHHEAAVIAWRDYPRTGVFVGGAQRIIE